MKLFSFVVLGISIFIDAGLCHRLIIWDIYRLYEDEPSTSMTLAEKAASSSCNNTLPTSTLVTPAEKAAPCYNNTLSSSTSIAPTERAAPAKKCYQPANPCYNNNTGYITEVTIGSCYKVHTVEKTWRQAISVCQEEGAHLAVSSWEDFHIRPEWRHLQLISKKTFNVPSFVFIGLWKSGNTFIGNDYMKANDDGTLDRILKKYPPEGCLQIFSANKTLYTGDCSRIFPFICEREL